MSLLLGAVLNMTLAMLWYSPMLFGQVWLNHSKGIAVGSSPEEQQTDAFKTMSMSSIGSFLTALVLALVIEKFETKTIGGGLYVGFIMWIGFVLPKYGAHSIMQQENPVVFAIHVVYDLISLLLVGAIFGYQNAKPKLTEEEKNKQQQQQPPRKPAGWAPPPVDQPKKSK